MIIRGQFYCFQALIIIIMEQAAIHEQNISTQINFDQQLLAQKKHLLDLILKNQNEAQQCLLQYPDKKIQQIAKSHLKENNKLTFFKSSNTLYFGQTCNDLYHGHGVLLYKNSLLRFYEGQFQNNCKYGYGMEYINGDLFIGKFLNNKPEDQNGIFIWANGDIYHGSFINGMKHGLGKWQSGDQFYSGTWKFNKPEGQGYIKSSLSQYNGDIKNGYKHGQGVELFNNGDRYDGTYSNGKPEGQGTYAWSNGSIYKGQFKNGLRFGYGVWQYGAQKYEGTYVNDKRNGQGIYQWSGGSYYKGSFIQDLRHGFGEMHWDDDSFYKGQWNEGIQSGEGQIWEKGKLIKKGLFQNGKLRAQNQDQLDGKLVPINNNYKKFNTQRTSQPPPQNQQLPHFQPRQKERFNSFHTRNDFYRYQGPKRDKVIHQSTYEKQNEVLLQKRRQINKRYSFLDRSYPDKRGTSVKFPLKKSNDKSIGKLQAKSKQKEVKTSIAKIQLYNKLRKQRKTQTIGKKLNPTNKLPKSYEREIMFENELTPIKWKNFAHIGNQ